MAEDALADVPLADLSLNEAARPKAPKIMGATEAHRRQGRKLAAIHRAHLMDIARIERMLAEIKTGAAPANALHSAVTSLDMAANMRRFGSLCGQECRVLNFHHDAEEYSLFPALEAHGDDALRAVVGKLREEHLVVHELLLRLERAAMTLMFDANDAIFAETVAIFEKLSAAIRSHFGYEEVEIEEAIGVYVGGI